MSNTISPEMEALKTKLKTTWESGDYGVFAKFMEANSIEFFNRLNISPQTRLLDIGCGAGQLAIPAARNGIKVTGLDLAQNLVNQAQTRAAEEGLDVEFEQGDAEALPYPDNSFDVVLSFIGAMFAPRPDLVASEMARVCKPSGKIIMGNWTAAGHVGQMFKVIGKHVPPPSIFPSPLLWGDEKVLRERFGSTTENLRITPQMFAFQYPFSPEEVVDFFIRYYGPTNRAYNVLADDKKSGLRDDLIDLWSSKNRKTDGTTEVLSEYVEVVGIKKTT